MAPEARARPRDLYLLLGAQFVSAFADNAVLFTAVAMALRGGERPAWYVPALQASFLVAFVLLAIWVGPHADGRPKPRVLVQANLIKALGALLMLLGMEPLAAYAVVGVGAAMYSPAKYGVLPELVAEERLVTANGWIEGSTILAIVAGSLGGAYAADQSIGLALALVVSAYLVSAAGAALITKIPATRGAPTHLLHHFQGLLRGLLATSRARFSALGVSLFWAAATVLRVALVAWAPAVLAISTTAGIAELTLYSALGVALGAFLAPRLVPLFHLRRARMAGYLMGLALILLGGVSEVWTARLVLLCVGLAGGVFVVPINAALQDIGHRSVGAGGAVAVQNFFENLAMLLATGLYALAAGRGADPILTLIVLGVAVVAATAVVSWHLPPDPHRGPGPP